MSSPFRFHQGDRVKRPEDVYAENWVYKFGTVIKAYSRWGDRIGRCPPCDYPELYAVLWDNGKVGRGYLPHGIEPALSRDGRPERGSGVNGRSWPLRGDENGNVYQDSKYGRAYRLGIDVPVRDPLTQEELEALPKGTPILILWPGGGGPFEYLLWKSPREKPHAILKDRPGGLIIGPGRQGVSGLKVGNGVRDTKVWTLGE